MLTTQSHYSIVHRVLGLAIPIILMLIYSQTGWPWTLSVAATSFVFGLFLLLLKIHFQWRDYRAFQMLRSQGYGLDYYEVKGRKFFIDDLAIESFIVMAQENGLKLEIHKDMNKARVDKSHLPCYRKGTEKF